MNNMLRFIALSVALLAGANVSAAVATADNYPSKVIRIVVGFPSGGPADIGARILAAGLQDSLKQNLIVDNRTGAGGNIAAQLVAKSPGDGYTLLVATASLLVNYALSLVTAGYDPVKDLVPVGVVATHANA